MLHKTGKYLKIFVASNRIIFHELKKVLGLIEKIHQNLIKLIMKTWLLCILMSKDLLKKKLIKFYLSHMLECLDIYWAKSGHIFFQSLHKISVCSWFATIYISILLKYMHK